MVTPVGLASASGADILEPIQQPLLPAFEDGDLRPIKWPSERASKAIDEAVLQSVMDYRLDYFCSDIVDEINEQVRNEAMASGVNAAVGQRGLAQERHNAAERFRTSVGANWDDHERFHVLVPSRMVGYHVDLLPDPAAQSRRLPAEGIVRRGEQLSHLRKPWDEPCGVVPPNPHRLFLRNVDDNGNRALTAQPAVLPPVQGQRSSIAPQVPCPQIAPLFVSQEMKSASPLHTFNDDRGGIAEAVHDERRQASSGIKPSLSPITANECRI